MSRRHIAAASVMLGTAAVAGVLAATRTTQPGQTAPPPTSAELAAPAAMLDRAEAEVRRTVAKLPPKLPPLSRAAAAPVPPEQVMVRRAQPTRLAGAHHDDGSEYGERSDD